MCVVDSKLRSYYLGDLNKAFEPISNDGDTGESWGYQRAQPEGTLTRASLAYLTCRNDVGESHSPMHGENPGLSLNFKKTLSIGKI
jgi:hypothetical protein